MLSKVASSLVSKELGPQKHLNKNCVDQWRKLNLKSWRYRFSLKRAQWKSQRIAWRCLTQVKLADRLRCCSCHRRMTWSRDQSYFRQKLLHLFLQRSLTKVASWWALKAQSIQRWRCLMKSVTKHRLNIKTKRSWLRSRNQLPKTPPMEISWPSTAQWSTSLA